MSSNNSNYKRRFVSASFNEESQQQKSLDSGSRSPTSGGLVTAEEFKRKRIESEEAKKSEELEKKKIIDDEKKKKRKREQDTSLLTFDLDDNCENTVKIKKSTKKRILKDDTVDTSFLPDGERDKIIKEEMERLSREWDQKQEEIRQEPLEVVYSYWDGSGHRFTATTTKGQTIENFLVQCRTHLSSKFREVKSVSADQLMFIENDLIIPHHVSFYDLLMVEGSHFSFDVKEDVRLTMNTKVAKRDSYASKVVIRSWYERNKHIFPANKWTVYDPTITDKNKNIYH